MVHIIIAVGCVVSVGRRTDSARLSIAFFAHPDNEWLVRCLDGSRRYEPITSLHYLNVRLDDTYADTDSRIIILNLVDATGF